MLPLVATSTPPPSPPISTCPAPHPPPGSQAAMLPLVVSRLVKQPERGAQLYSLSGGPGYEAGGGDTSRVDVPRIVRILANK